MIGSFRPTTRSSDYPSSLPTWFAARCCDHERVSSCGVHGPGGDATIPIVFGVARPGRASTVGQASPGRAAT